jgi:hypothetical protein
LTRISLEREARPGGGSGPAGLFVERISAVICIKRLPGFQSAGLRGRRRIDLSKPGVRAYS